MKFLYNIVFIPSGKSVEDITESKIIEIYNEDRFNSKDILRNEAKKIANYKGKIDQYALRNYWKIGCCELELVDSPWSDIQELSEYMKSEHDVKNISRTENNWRHESLECTFSSPEKRKEEQKNIERKFNGKLPVVSKRSNLRIALRAKANVGMNSFQEAKKVFSLSQKWGDLSN
jgi:hypothetical protein